MQADIPGKKTEFAYPGTVFWKKFCRGLYTLVNNINPGLIKQIFQLEETRKLVWKQYKPHVSVSKFNHISCGEESQSYYVPKILISLLFHDKTRESIKTFRDIINFFFNSPAPVNTLHITHKILMYIHAKTICF